MTKQHKALQALIAMLSIEQVKDLRRHLIAIEKTITKRIVE